MIANDYRDNIEFSDQNYDNIISNLEKIYNPEVMLDLIFTGQSRILKDDTDEL